MSKTSKFLVILGCMFALGILLSVIGAALGGNLAAASITQDKIETQDINQTMENAADIQNLSFDVSACNVTLKQGDSFSIQGKGISKCQVKNGTWYVSSKRQRGFHLFGFHLLGLIPNNITKMFTANTDYKATITIPSNRTLNKISLDAQAISCRIERIDCQKLDIDVAAGSVRIAELNSDEADISVSAGDIRINTFQIRGEAEISCSMGDIRLGSKETRAENLCNKLDAKCNMGDVKYYGKLTGENDVDVTMGSINLNLTGNAGQYDFSSDIALGSVKNQSGEGSSQQTAPFYGKGNLSCTMGEISVLYDGE